MEIIKFIQSFASPFLDGFFQTVTMLGEEYFYIVMLALVFWCIDKQYGYKLSFAFLLSGVINGVIKSIVSAPRPIGTEGIRSLRVETATGTSFPSGHTQNTTSFFVSVIWSDSADLVKTAATFSAFLIGFSIEPKWIQFETKASLAKQAVKFIAGFAVVLVLKEGLKMLFPKAPFFDFIRYLILGLWITAGAPLVFKLFKLSSVAVSHENNSVGM